MFVRRSLPRRDECLLEAAFPGDNRLFESSKSQRDFANLITMVISLLNLLFTSRVVVVAVVESAPLLRQDVDRSNKLLTFAVT